MKYRTIFMAFATAVAFAATPAVQNFDNELLHYAVNWPSGLSLGEVQIRSTRVKPTPKSAERYDFEFSIDAAVPGFAVSDRYRSEASKDFCSLEFDKNLAHGKKKTDEKTTFDPEKSTATRETKDGGKTDLSTLQCAKDALDFLYFVRHELAQGRLAAPQKIYFGSPYDVRVEFAGTQMIRLGDSSVEADHLNATLKGPQSDIHFEMYFLKDPARTLALVRVPLAVGTFSMELMK